MNSASKDETREVKRMKTETTELSKSLPEKFVETENQNVENYKLQVKLNIVRKEFNTMKQKLCRNCLNNYANAFLMGLEPVKIDPKFVKESEVDESDIVSYRQCRVPIEAEFFSHKLGRLFKVGDECQYLARSEDGKLVGHYKSHIEECHPEEIVESYEDCFGELKTCTYKEFKALNDNLMGVFMYQERAVIEAICKL